MTEAMGCQVLPTVGQLFYETKPIYNPTNDDFTRWYQNGFALTELAPEKGLNLHAWWTLSSGEVLDISLMSTLAVVFGIPNIAGQINGGWPDKFPPAYEYVPIVVGQDVICEIQKKTGFRFLESILK